MSPDEEAFLAAIAAAPADEAPRLIFADWLEEHDDPRAPWLRDPVIAPFMGLRCEDPVPRLIEALPGPSEWVEALVRIGAPAIAPLLQALRARHPGRRTQIQQVLSQLTIELAPFVPQLEADLNSDEAETREAALLALGCMGEVGGAALMVLVARLRDPLEAERLAALDALAQLGEAGAPAVPQVLEAWRQEEASRSGIQFRQRAAMTLARLAPAGAEAIPVLAASLVNPNLFDSALAGLHHYGAAAIDPLTAALDRVDLTSAISVAHVLLAVAEDPANFAATQLMGTRLGNRGRRALINACPLLGDTGFPTILPAIVRQFESDDVAVARTAMEALGHCGPRAIEALVPLERAARMPSEVLRQAALEAMTRISPSAQRTRSALRRGLADRHVDVRRAAWEAYVEIDAVHDAFREVRELFGDNDPELRAAGAEGLGRMLEFAEEAEEFDIDDDGFAIDPADAVTDARTEEAGEEALELLADGLTDRSKQVRIAASAALGNSILESAEDLLEPLLEATRDPVPAVRANACRAIARLENYDEDTIPALLEASRDDELDVRCAAIYALGACRDDEDERVLEKLETALLHKNARVRAAAAWGFSDWPDLPRAAVRALPDLLRDADPDVRNAAQEMVSGAKAWPWQRMVEAYRAGLRDSVKEVRETALDNLLEMEAEQRDVALPELIGLMETENDEELLQFIEGAMRDCPSRGAGLASLLSRANERVRIRVLTALHGAGPSAAPAVPAILAELDREVESTWALSIQALHGIGSGAAAAFPRLAQMLESEGGASREFALQVVGTLGPVAEPAIERIEQIARDDFGGARYQAIQALAEMVAWTDRTTPRVLQALQGEDSCAAASAVLGLATVGARAAPFVPELTRLLRDAGRTLHYPLVQAIARIGPPAAACTPALVDILQRQPENLDLTDVVDTLGALGDSAVPALTRIANDDDSKELRGAAIRALGRSRLPAALTSLRPLLFDRELDIRDMAAQAIVLFGEDGRAAIPDLCRALDDPRWGRARRSYDRRLTVLDALSAMKAAAEPAIPDLRRALEDPVEEVRVRAVEVLGAIGPTAQAVLNKALRSKDPEVSAAAKDALRSLGQ